MQTASVGFHCPECARSGGQRVITARTLLAGSRPIVAQTLIGINVAVFVVGLGMGASAEASRQGLTLDLGLLGRGVSDGTPIGVDAGEWWRIVTSGFVHSGLIHLGFNMFLLWILGRVLEPALGSVTFAVVYLTSLLAGSFGVLLLDPGSLTVGASGAVFGLMGVTIVFQRSQGIDPWDSGVGGLVLINLAITFLIPGISIGGHVGGLIGGLMAGGLVLGLKDRVKTPVLPVVLCAALGAAFVLGSLYAASRWMDPLL